MIRTPGITKRKNYKILTLVASRKNNSMIQHTRDRNCDEKETRHSLYIKPVQFPSMFLIWNFCADSRQPKMLYLLVCTTRVVF